jgi:tetratricopeptide (TPR) repeat protein
MGGLTPRSQSVALKQLGLMARGLGRLQEAAEIHREDDALFVQLRQTDLDFQDTCMLLLDLGRLSEALVIADRALTYAEIADNNAERYHALTARAATQHKLGNIAAARHDFAAASALEDAPVPYSPPDQDHARHHLDLGGIVVCRAITEAGSRISELSERRNELPGWHALFARIALAEGDNPSRYIDEIRVWTARTGDMECILEAHALAARAALARGDLDTARAEADDGLRQARLCGYRLRQIELLVTLSKIDLAWPDAPKAIQSAREALDLATASDCGYAWGEADAAQVWGESYFANHEPALAQRAFKQALKVRKRIEHPGVAETKRWLAMAGA